MRSDPSGQTTRCSGRTGQTQWGNHPDLQLFCTNLDFVLYLVVHQHMPITRNWLPPGEDFGERKSYIDTSREPHFHPRALLEEELAFARRSNFYRL